MSALIEDEDKARRLAHAIMADITLYNSDRLAHAMDPERDLAEQLDEGRQLFQSRATPRLHMIFEDAVHKWAADARSRATPGAPAPPRPREEGQRAILSDVDQDRRRAEALESAKRTRTAMLLALVLIVVAVATFVFLSHERPHDAPDKHEGHR